MKYYNKEGKIVGELFSNGVYHSERNPKHFMRIYQGYGISLSILNKLLELGCKSIIITYIGQNGTRVLKTPLTDWLNSKKTYTFEETDKQYFISEKDMELIKENPSH